MTRRGSLPLTATRVSIGMAFFLGLGTSLAQSDMASSAQAQNQSESRGDQGSQRIGYMALQVPLTTALYGVGLPWALDAGSTRARIATPLLVAPFAFGAHLWVAKNVPFTQAHRQGTSYLALASLYAAFAIPASAINDNDTRWRTAAWTSMAVYPLGVYGGYLLGDAYVNEPDRIATQARYALGFGMLGFFTPLLYFEDFADNQEAMLRIGLAQSVGMATLGHFVSRYQQVGPEAAGGVQLGLWNHTALGIAAGLTGAAWCDASSLRPWLGGAVLGGTLGFMEGLWFFHDSRDSRERGIFSMLGGAAGTLAGLGLTLLTFDEDASGYSQRVTAASLLAGGAWLGYVGGYLLTQSMQETRRAASGKGVPIAQNDWSWTFIPVPIVTPEQNEAKKTTWRYSIPGFAARF